MSDADNNTVAAMCAAHASVKTEGRFPAGTVFGDWLLTAFIGRGGSGEVYCAEHVALGTAARPVQCRESRASRAQRAELTRSPGRTSRPKPRNDQGA